MIRRRRADDLPRSERRAQRPEPFAWPFGELTEAQITGRLCQEARMRSGTLARFRMSQFAPTELDINL